MNSAFSAVLHMHCTVAWCSKVAGTIDRGMGIHLRLAVRDSGEGLPQEENLQSLRSELFRSLDHGPLDPQRVFSLAQAAEAIAHEIQRAVLPPLQPLWAEMELSPELWWRYSWEK